MGNCQVNSQHINVDNPTTGFPSRKPLAREGKESTESTIDLDRETDSVTVALSPGGGSTLSPASVSPVSYYSLSPLTPKHQYLSLSSSHNSDQQDSISAYNVVASPTRKQSLLDASSSPPRRQQGRALQHRLEKARYLQMALSNQSLGSNASASLVRSHSHTLEGECSSSQHQSTATPTASYRYSLSVPLSSRIHSVGRSSIH
jgi:hypothetical protein